jgi:hypothetical protein
MPCLDVRFLGYRGYPFIPSDAQIYTRDAPGWKRFIPSRRSTWIVPGLIGEWAAGKQLIYSVYSQWFRNGEEIRRKCRTAMAMLGS